MDIYKKMTVWELLNYLKSKVKKNVDAINSEINELNGMRSKKTTANSNQTSINRINSDISKLTSENNQLLSLFNNLLTAHNQYFVGGFTFKESENSNNSENHLQSINNSEECISDWIEQTISGSLPIDENNPLLINKEYIDFLFERCKQDELYEKCDKIIKLKKDYYDLK
ncbi:MAG: hypothetical protein JXB49_31015 [Bacteroidales bacterium]|nr:hypothetical protein [Bacteroidales bacterium]MBN2820729.1 hypothetical protein [Bacteroidales bacterium]